MQGKKILVVLFAAFVIVYALFIIIRPYEEDESHHILSGIAMLRGELQPFQPFYGQYTNPFTFTLGSPLAPLLYGAAFLVGGIVASRLLCLVYILISLFLVYKIIKRNNGNWIIPMVLLGFSASTILLASDAFLDSFALLFLVSSIYAFDSGRMLPAGIFTALAAAAKFVLIPSALFMLLYVLWKKPSKRFFLGLLLVAVPFSVLYWNLAMPLALFVISSKIGAPSLDKLYFFLEGALYCVPLITILFLFALGRRKLERKTAYLLIPIGTVMIYHLLSLDVVALARHLPYVEFTAAIALGIHWKKLKIKKIHLAFLAMYLIANLSFAWGSVINYPSYNSIESDLKIVDGKTLAVNLKSFMLIKGLPINATEDQVFSYYYFCYKDNPCSSLDSFKNAIGDDFFDYALIESYTPKNQDRYKAIEDMIRNRYCQIVKGPQNGGGIDIYRRC